MSCQRFGGWIDHVKGRDVVECAIAKRRDDRAQVCVERMKVAQEFFVVELGAADANDHPPIVAMHRLAYAADHDRMRCGKLGLNLKRKWVREGSGSIVKH